MYLVSFFPAVHNQEGESVIDSNRKSLLAFYFLKLKGNNYYLNYEQHRRESIQDIYLRDRAKGLHNNFEPFFHTRPFLQWTLLVR